MEGGTRYCPLCDTTSELRVCPTDGVSTVPRRAQPPKDETFEPGQVIAEGRYRVDRLLGAGGMGSVYAATQVAVRRTVALKVLNGDLGGNDVELRRFYREARLASQLKHPNVVGIYDFGIEETTNTPYIVMEYVAGQSLRALFQAEGALTQERTAHLLEQVARALVAAHEAGLVHRDLKPDNVMVSRLPDGLEHVTVLDFGIAKAVAAETGGSAPLTSSGAVLGTPRYMSPEQVQAKDLDGRSDLYALGCILHEALSGRPPFAADQLVAMMLAHLHAPRPDFPVPAGGERPDPRLVELHRGLLRVDRDERPADARVVAAVLRAVARGPQAPDANANVPNATPVAPGTAAASAAPRASEPGLDDTLRRDDTASTVGAGSLGGWRRTALAVLGGVALAACGTAAYVLTRPTATVEPIVESPRPLPVSATVADASAALAVRTATAGAPVAASDAGAAGPVDAAVVSEAAVVVESDPPGAAVSSGARVLGTTPLRVMVPAEGLAVVVQKKGYAAQALRLTPEGAPRRGVRLKPSIIPKF